MGQQPLVVDRLRWRPRVVDNDVVADRHEGRMAHHPHELVHPVGEALEIAGR